MFHRILDVNGTTKGKKKRSANNGMQQKLAQQKDRASLVLWRRPFMTFYYFLMELLELTYELGVK